MGKSFWQMRQVGCQLICATMLKIPCLAGWRKAGPSGLGRPPVFLGDVLGLGQTRWDGSQPALPSLFQAPETSSKLFEVTALTRQKRSGSPRHKNHRVVCK